MSPRLFHWPAGTYWFLMIVDFNTVQLGNAAGTAGHLWIDGGQPYSMPAVAPSAFNTDTPIISIYGNIFHRAGSGEYGRPCDCRHGSGWPNSHSNDWHMD